MIRVILLIASLTLSMVVEGQNKYSKDMQEALALFNEGNYEKAIPTFEQIASYSEQEWLPNYYVSLSYIMNSFTVSDKIRKKELLENADTYFQNIASSQAQNPEVMNLEAMLYMGWIVYNPMQYGALYFNSVLEVYNRARKIDSANPRVAYMAVQFDMNSTRYLGGDPMDFCLDLEKAIELFHNFKPESEFHPNWGLDQAEDLYTKCAK